MDTKSALEFLPNFHTSLPKILTLICETRRLLFQNRDEELSALLSIDSIGILLLISLAGVYCAIQAHMTFKRGGVSPTVKRLQRQMFRAFLFQVSFVTCLLFLQSLAHNSRQLSASLSDRLPIAVHLPPYMCCPCHPNQKRRHRSTSHQQHRAPLLFVSPLQSACNNVLHKRLSRISLLFTLPLETIAACATSFKYCNMNSYPTTEKKHSIARRSRTEAVRMLDKFLFAVRKLLFVALLNLGNSELRMAPNPSLQ